MLPCLAAAACQPPPQAVRVERAVVLMGTVATFAAEAGDRGEALARLERMVRVVEAAEAELSTWRGDSALSALNRQPPGEPLALGPPLCGLFERLEDWRRATGGAFDPAIGSLVEAWGLRAAGRRPDAASLRAALGRAGWPKLEFDRAGCTVVRRADVTLDAGGFGKGEALDRVREAMRGWSGAWLIDFGGQVAVSGAPDGGAWPVALAHPDRRAEPVAELRLAAGSLATSGGSERNLAADGGGPIGHVVDPRSGATVGRRGSVVVWRADAFEADVLSTALHVMGPEEGLAWAAGRGLAACFLHADPRSGAVTFRPTPAFAARFALPPPGPREPAAPSGAQG